MENTVKGMLQFASECETEPDTLTLLTALKERFIYEPGYAGLQIANDEFHMEDSKPHVRFELHRVISADYVTVIRPEIREEKLSLYIATYRMLDGDGMQSKRWEVAHDMEEDFAPESDMDLEALALRAKRIAVTQHVSLLEKLAVPRAEAQELCKRLWS